MEDYSHSHRETDQPKLLETLSKVAARIAGFLSLDELLPYVVGLLHDHFGYYQVHIFLLDEESEELVVAAGKGDYKGARSTVGRRLPLAKGINGRVAQTGQPHLSNDVSKDPVFSYVEELSDTRSELTVPVKVEGRLLGTLDVQSSEVNAFSPTDVLTLQIIADQLGIAITNARLFEKSRKQNLRLSVLNRLAVEISSSRQRDEVMTLIIESARKLLSGSRALLLTFYDKTPTVFEGGLSNNLLVPARKLAFLFAEVDGEVKSEWLEERECRYYNVTHSENWPVRLRECLTDLGLARFFTAPLVSRRGRVFGLLLISAENTQEDPGNFLQLVQAFAYQSSAALENARLFEDVQNSEAKLADLYENAPDMYQSLDSSGVVAACNRTQERILGISKSEMIGKPFSVWVHPDSQEIWQYHLRKVLHSEEESGCPIQLVLPNRKVLDVEVHSRRFLSGEGGMFVRSVLRDVTEKRKLERQLLYSQKMDSVGTLAAGFAHEFNNLLGGIMGYASLAREVGQYDHIEKDLDQIVRITERARKLVQNLLTFSNKSAEESWLPIDIEKVLREAAGLAAQEIKDKNLRLEWEIEQVPPFIGQRNQLVQVFLNLLVNAIHAIEKDGNITITVKPSIKGLQVLVADTGCGISPENLPRIFDPFFSTKGIYGDTRYSGPGLGLTVSYNVIKAHSGEIEVASEVGKGTTFTVTFPLIQKTVLKHNFTALDSSATPKI